MHFGGIPMLHMEQFEGTNTSWKDRGRLPEIKDIVHQLKEACTNNDYEQQVKAYIALGNHYFSQKQDYINAIAIYNFALALCQDDKKNQKFKQTALQLSENTVSLIKSAEQEFLHRDTGKNLPSSSYTFNQSNKAYLKGIRDKASASLVQYKAIAKTIELQLSENIKGLERAQTIQNFLEREHLSIQQIYQQISQQMREFVKLMIEEFKLQLSDWRKPPKEEDYAIICFGSLARDEATPYSDLEFGILLKEGSDIEYNKTYFKILTKLLNIKVINLGETTPRMHEIEELKIAGLADRYSESPSIPGFSFDGNNKDGRKTPLGNKDFDVPKDKKYELISTPKQMAKLHNEKWFAKDKHLSTALMVATTIEGNKELCNEYECEVRKVIQGIIQKRSLALLRESVEKFQFRGGRFDKEGHFFDIKYHLYRLPNMFIDHLASYFNITTKSLWQRIDSLFGEAGFVPNIKAKVNLKWVTSSVLYLRLSSYIDKNNRNNRIIMIVPKNKQWDSIPELNCQEIAKEDLLEIYAFLIPLEKAVEEFIRCKGSIKVLMRGNYYNHDFFFEGYFNGLIMDYKNAIEAYERAIEDRVKHYGEQSIEVVRAVASLGNIYRDTSCYGQAKEKYEKTVNILEVLSNPEYNIELASTTENLGAVYDALGMPHEACSKYERAIELMEKMEDEDIKEHLLQPLTNIIPIYQGLDRHNEAEKSYQKILELEKFIHKNNGYLTELVLGFVGDACLYLGKHNEAISKYEAAIYKAKEKYGDQHIKVARLLNNKARIWLNQNKYNEALATFEEVRIIYEKQFKTKQHNNIKAILINIGKVYYEQKKYEEAMVAFNRALAIKISENFSAQSDIQDIETFKYKGLVYRSQRHYYKALLQLKEARSVLQKVYGMNSTMVASNLVDIGRVCKDLHCYNEAIQHFTDSIKIKKSIYGELSIEVAETLADLGLTFYYQFSYDETMKCLTKARDIYEEKYKIEDDIVENYTKILNNIGLVLVEQKNYDEARKLYYKAINISDQKILRRNLSNSYLREANNFMLQNKIKNAEDCYKKFDPNFNYMSVKSHQELVNIFYVSELLPATIEQLQVILLLNKENVYAQSTLAYMFHVRAQIEFDKGEFKKYLLYLKDAQTYFENSLQLNGDHDTHIRVRYIQFLLNSKKTDSLQEAIKILSAVINLNKNGNEKNQCVRYEMIERSILDIYMQQLIDDENTIIIRTNLLAHYLLIHVYLRMNRVKDAEQIFDIFRKQKEFLMEIHRYEKSDIEDKNKEVRCLDLHISSSQVAINSSKIQPYNQAHDQLLFTVIETSGTRDDIKPIINAIQDKKYAKALRIASTATGDDILKLVTILIKFKKKLNININEQAGEKHLAAIHYAALRGNQSLYDLLVEHSADVNLKDKDNKTAEEYMKKYEEERQSVRLRY
jgi:tetratricopeptide (TPR) repeat protein